MYVGDIHTHKKYDLTMNSREKNPDPLEPYGLYAVIYDIKYGRKQEQKAVHE